MSGDYEHCINALRQLQKTVTVNLVYDPKKVLYKKGPEALAEAKRDKKDLKALKKLIMQEDGLDSGSQNSDKDAKVLKDEKEDPEMNDLTEDKQEY